MAKSAVIGALRVMMGIDTAQFQAGVARVGKSMDGLAKRVAVFGAAAGAAMTAAVGALSVAVKRTIDEADNMAKSAQKFGVGVEELSRLKHAADLSGVSLETLGKGMQRLSRNMTDAEQGLQAPMRAFDALGISIKNADGTLKTSSQIMTEVAGRFAQMQDGVAKTSLAMQLFGRAGAELIPMLNGGADGLREMMEEADRLGIVIDNNTGKAAEALNDNLTRLGRVKDGLVLKITAHLLPALERLSEMLIAFARDGDAVRSVAERITHAFNFLSKEVARLIGGLAGLKAEIAGIAEAWNRLQNLDFSGALAAFNEGQNAAVRMREEMVKAVDGVFSGDFISQGQIGRRISDAFGDAGKAAGENFVANFAVAGKKIKEKIDPLIAEAARIFESTRTPLEQYQAQIARLNQLLEAGAISQDTYNRAVIQAQDAFAQAEEAGKRTESVFMQIGQTMASSFSYAFTSIIDGSRKVGDVIADLLKQLANLLMNKAFQMLFSMIGGGGGLGLNYFPPVPGFANGTNFAPGGMAWVGERGPELINLPRGSQVIPNHELGGIGRSIQEVRLIVEAEEGDMFRPIIRAESQGVAVNVVQGYDRSRKKSHQAGGQFG